jgi:hypothetical protein
MKLLSILVILSAVLFVGCGGGSSNGSDSVVTRSNAPQPSGVDEAVRPPKPPSI